MYLNIENDNLKEVVESHPKVMAMFGAQWCDDAKKMQPDFENMATKNPSITYVYLDYDQSPLSRRMVTENELPLFALFYDGRYIKQEPTNKIEEVQKLNQELLDLN